MVGPTGARSCLRCADSTTGRSPARPSRLPLLEVIARNQQPILGARTRVPLQLGDRPPSSSCAPSCSGSTLRRRYRGNLQAMSRPSQSDCRCLTHEASPGSGSQSRHLQHAEKMAEGIVQKVARPPRRLGRLAPPPLSEKAFLPVLIWGLHLFVRPPQRARARTRKRGSILVSTSTQ